MSEMTLDPVLWTGLVLMAGALGAMAARSVKAPAACGAMAGGFALAALMGDGGSHVPALIQGLLPAFLAFLLGAELELPRLLRIGRSAMAVIALQAVAVIGLVFLACLALGLPGGVSMAVALAAVAASPAAIIAVVSESRARGDFTQRLLLASSASFLAAVALVELVRDTPASLAWAGAGLFVGLLGGFILLMILSRMSSRGAIVACVCAGLTLTAIATGRVSSGGTSFMAVSILAGFMAGTLAQNREVIRDALRGLALPGAVALFAMAGARIDPSTLTYLLPAALALVIARGLALVLAGMGARGRSFGVGQAGLVPMAGVAVITPRSDGLELLLVAGFLSECFGMLATRWALVRSAEAAGAVEDPEAWRARMR
ncbi:MAG TPA: hypothetical protein VGK94_05950 [Candidatus Polarisedimenticolia bacterium]|jgi:Kef-type K+ transport system membrane component KefB